MSDVTTQLFGFEIPTFNMEWLGSLGPVLQDLFNNLITNINPVEIGVIISMFFILLLVLRAKVVVHLFLWIMAGVIVAVIFGFATGLINI